MIISPQLGQGNFVASVPGAIIRWHEVHVGTLIVVVVLSVTLTPQRGFGMSLLLYMCCVLMLCADCGSSFLSLHYRSSKRFCGPPHGGVGGIV